MNFLDDLYGWPSSGQAVYQPYSMGVNIMKEMNRREFLMASAAAGATLMAGSLLKGGPSVAYGSAKIPEVEKLVVTVITDNYYDCLRWNYKIAKNDYGISSFN